MSTITPSKRKVTPQRITKGGAMSVYTNLRYLCAAFCEVKTLNCIFLFAPVQIEFLECISMITSHYESFIVSDQENLLKAGMKTTLQKLLMWSILNRPSWQLAEQIMTGSLPLFPKDHNARQHSSEQVSFLRPHASGHMTERWQRC